MSDTCPGGIQTHYETPYRKSVNSRKSMKKIADITLFPKSFEITDCIYVKYFNVKYSLKNISSEFFIK